jgi:maleate isomerase
MIVPSSNTCVEPATYRMLDGRTDVTVHFARVPVTRIALDDNSDAQFGIAGMQGAAELLATAEVDVIAWIGTAGSWLGTRHDRAITAAITEATGLPATTSTLAYFEAFRRLGVRTVGIVTPYTDGVNARIIARYRDEGIAVCAQYGFGLTDNTAFGRITPDDLLAPSRRVAESRPDALLYLCTNLNGVPVVDTVETETGVPVLDSVAITLQACLTMIGAQALPSRWGRHLASR